MVLGQAYVRIGADATAFHRTLGLVRGSMTRLTSSFAKLIPVAQRVFLVTAGALVGAAYAAIAYEKQLAHVSTMLSTKHMPMMEQYRKQLLQLSVAYGQSTASMADSLYTVLSATFAPAEAMKIVEAASRLAVAGGTDVAVATKALISMLKAYGLEAKYAARVSDILFGAVKTGQFTFEELAWNVGKSVTITRLAGIGMKEYLAVIATITKTGRNCAQVMTNVNGIMRAFLKPSKRAKKAAAEFGLVLSVETLRTEGLRGSLAKLAKAREDQLAKIFPNIRGLVGYAALLLNVEEYERSLKDVTDSQGLTLENLKKRTETATFALSQMKRSVLALAITAGERLLPDIMGVVGGITSFIKWLGSASAATISSTMNILKWTAGISLAIIVIPKFISGISTIIRVLTSMPGLLAITGAAMLVLFNVAGIRDWLFNLQIAGVKIKEYLGLAGLYVLRTWEETKSGFAVILEYMMHYSTVTAAHIKYAFLTAWTSITIGAQEWMNAIVVGWKALLVEQAKLRVWTAEKLGMEGAAKERRKYLKDLQESYRVSLFKWKAPDWGAAWAKERKQLELDLARVLGIHQVAETKIGEALHKRTKDLEDVIALQKEEIKLAKERHKLEKAAKEETKLKLLEDELERWKKEMALRLPEIEARAAPGGAEAATESKKNLLFRKAREAIFWGQAAVRMPTIGKKSPEEEQLAKISVNTKGATEHLADINAKLPGVATYG